MTQKFLPLLKPTGRLVNVSSMAGNLGKYGPSLQKGFREAKTVEEVTGLMQKFAQDVENGREREEGWVRAAYATSKAGMYMSSWEVAGLECGLRMWTNVCRGHGNDESHRVPRAAVRIEETDQCLLSGLCEDGYDEGWWSKDTGSGCSDTCLAVDWGYYGTDRAVLAEREGAVVVMGDLEKDRKWKLDCMLDGKVHGRFWSVLNLWTSRPGLLE
jgi:hypothetical protein